jgi:phosphoribosylanthranilate isomerase
MEYVKICGLKNFKDVELCINNGANIVGFICNVPESPRNLDKTEIIELLNEIPKDIRTVLVSKPKNASEVAEIMNQIEADLYQVHIRFNIRSLDRFSTEIKKKLIIALKVDEENKSSVIQKINLSFNQFFAFLLDSSEGQGIEFDYDLVLEILKKTYGTKVILAGGVSIGNVENIIKILKPFGIDVSSSLESEKGIKDPKKIKNFLEKLIEIKQEIVV